MLTSVPFCACTGKTDKGAEPGVELKQLAEQVAKTSPNVMLGVGIIIVALTMRNFTRPDTQEISFQHFKTQLLAKDVVDRIEVANKTTAKVCFVQACGVAALRWLSCFNSLFVAL